MQDRLSKTGKAPASAPGAPRAARLPAPDPARLERKSGATGLLSQPVRSCSTCREDLAVPDLNYRLVLRCTTTGLDH